jgi:hypothetical protein
MRKKSWSRSLRQKKARSGEQYPVGTIAFYGPDESYASKVAVGIKTSEHRDVEALERWFDDGVDVRVDRRIGQAVVDFLKHHGVRTVVVADRIIGCPHEEGVDYPDGKECPACPWWHGRDRWTGERVSGNS